MKYFDNFEKIWEYKRKIFTNDFPVILNVFKFYLLLIKHDNKCK